MSDFWIQCLDLLKSQTPQNVYENWFSDLTADTDKLEAQATITIKASSTYKIRNLQTTYGSLIALVVNSLAGKEVTINWEAVSETPSAQPAPAEVTPVSAPAAVDPTSGTGLLPSLTFENFETGRANQLAFAAALQVAESDRAIYNPLFIYGGVGLGKTHLMHAIGHRYLKNHPNARIRCVSANQYFQEYVEAVSHKDSNPEGMQRFEARYKNLDLFLLDDIQSFGPRTGTQANFFQTFENMVPLGKQIVLTSDTFPRLLKDFSERLLSRLSQGLNVAVEPPELELRVQILHNKARQCHLELPQDVAVFIAQQLKSNVRELEGAIQQIHAYTNFHQIPASVDSARHALRDMLRVSAVPVSVERIQDVVADYYDLSLSDMHSKTRTAKVAHARQVAMYLSKELTSKSLPEIGKLFGGKNHATVLHAYKKIQEEQATNEEVRHDLNVLEQTIKN